MSNQNALTSDIVKISDSVIDGKSTPTANARELHARLEVSKDFSTWVKAQIKRARLIDGRDFIKVTQKGELSATGQTLFEYHLTLDASKHIAMLSNTEKGFEVREYFIACERALKTKVEAPTLSNPIMNMIVQQAIQYDLLERQQKELAAQLQRATSLISATSSRVEQVAAIVGAQDPQYYSIKAYANIVGARVDDKQASRMGKLATKLSNEANTDIGKVRDAVYGHVNAYHESILETVFSPATTE